MVSDFKTETRAEEISSVLYGNLSPETTEERLVNFIQARSTAVGVKPPNVINSRMFEPRDGRERIAARLTVASSDAGVPAGD